MLQQNKIQIEFQNKRPFIKMNNKIINIINLYVHSKELINYV